MRPQQEAVPGRAGGAAPAGAVPGGATAEGATAAGATASGAAPGRGRRTGGKGDPWKTAFIVLIAVAIVAGAGWALLGSSLLVVRSVQAAGTALVPRSEILRAAGIGIGTPLIRVNTGQVARRVEQIAQIQSARVTRNWPDRVTIVVRDRTPALAVAASGRYALVDQSGVVVRWVAKRPPGMPLLADPPAGSTARLRGDAAIRAAVTVLRQLPVSLRRRIRAVRAPAADAVTLELRGRIVVLWGGTDRPSGEGRRARCPDAPPCHRL